MKIQKKIEFFENFITAQPGKSTTSDESKKNNIFRKILEKFFFDFFQRVTPMKIQKKSKNRKIKKKH